MKKLSFNVLLAILIGGLIFLYIINPLNRLIELNGWYTFILLGIVMLRVVNKSKIIDIIIRIMGVCFFLYLVLNYFI